MSGVCLVEEEYGQRSMVCVKLWAAVCSPPIMGKTRSHGTMWKEHLLKGWRALTLKKFEAEWGKLTAERDDGLFLLSRFLVWLQQHRMLSFGCSGPRLCKLSSLRQFARCRRPGSRGIATARCGDLNDRCCQHPKLDDVPISARVRLPSLFEKSFVIFSRPSQTFHEIEIEIRRKDAIRAPKHLSRSGVREFTIWSL